MPVILLPSHDFSFENYSLQEIKKRGENVPCGIIFMPNTKKAISWHKLYWYRQKDANRGKREVREAA
jgi:hypothetical protein